MSDEDESVVRAAYEAYGRGEMDSLLKLVDPDLEWTYLDPSMADPQPETCHGREQLAQMLEQQADRGFVSEVEEIASSGDKVMVAVRTYRSARVPEPWKAGWLRCSRRGRISRWSGRSSRPRMRQGGSQLHPDSRCDLQAARWQPAACGRRAGG